MSAEADALRSSNESVHRLCDHMMSVLNEETTDAQDQSFFIMVLDHVATHGSHAVEELAAWLAIARKQL